MIDDKYVGIWSFRDENKPSWEIMPTGTVWYTDGCGRGLSTYTTEQATALIDAGQWVRITE